MFIVNGNSLINNLNTGQILTGLDLGDKTIGVAISDKNLIIGSPLITIARKNTKKDIEELKIIFREYNIGGIVLGLPLGLDGSENIRTKKTREFGKKLIINAGIDTYLQDERFSTDVIYKQMINTSISRKKIKKYIDKASASYILQSFLEKYKSNNLQNI